MRIIVLLFLLYLCLSMSLSHRTLFCVHKKQDWQQIMGLIKPQQMQSHLLKTSHTDSEETDEM